MIPLIPARRFIGRELGRNFFNFVLPSAECSEIYTTIKSFYSAIKVVEVITHWWMEITNVVCDGNISSRRHPLFQDPGFRKYCTRLNIMPD